MSDSQTSTLEVDTKPVTVDPFTGNSPSSPETLVKIRAGVKRENFELPEDFKWPEYHPVITDDCRSALCKYVVGHGVIEERWQYANADIAHYDRFGRPTPGFPVSWFFRYLTAPQARLLDLAASYEPEFRKGQEVEVAGLMQCLKEEYPSEFSHSIYKKALKSLLKREILSGYHTHASRFFLRYPIDNGQICFKADSQRLYADVLRSNVCVYCGKWLTAKNFSRDHVDPKRHGGAKEARNIVSCCERCNGCKGGRTPEQWALDILNYKHRRKYNGGRSPVQKAFRTIVRNFQRIRARFVCFVFAWARG